MNRLIGIRPMSGTIDPEAFESRVRIIGKDDPIYPSPLRVGSSAAHLLALIGVAITEVSPRLSRERGRIEIDRVHALLTLSSLWLLKVDGVPAMQKFRPMQIPGDGIYECRDGRLVHLMNAFPHLTRATLKALDCSSGDSVHEVVAQLDSEEVEARLNEARLPGVVIRDHEGWLSSPQGALLRSAPPVTITRVGDGPRIPLPEEPDPLAGLRVLDATRVLAGPTCGRTLAALGADVLNVAPPDPIDLVAAQIDTGHGKRRAAVDLDTPEGESTMWRLVEEADVFSQSYRADSLSARGFGVDQIAAKRPGIVYVTETAYGNFGPWRTKRGFDSNVQAATGMLLLHGDPRGNDSYRRLPIAMNDYCTGYWAAYGVLQALKRRASEGGSWHVEVSLAQTAMWLMREGTVDASDAESPDSLRKIATSYAEHVHSDFGSVERLKFPIRFPNTLPGWTPPVRPGANEAAWIDRSSDC